MLPASSEPDPRLLVGLQPISSKPQVTFSSPLVIPGKLMVTTGGYGKGGEIPREWKEYIPSE